ncbi:glycosyltransferase involved in cell wall biosynthesis [Bradyrhizobium yuanmingense]|uniref:glycosyltransferase n=1 Tax=Bradyrhizobium yuanmingense TaxID=108015 RepID=UPI003513A052
MRVLWLGRSVDLTLDAGDRVYSYSFVCAVAEQPGVTLSYIGLTDQDKGQFEPSSLAVDWRPVHARANSSLKFLYSSLPMSGAKNDVREYTDAIFQALTREPWDVVVLDHYALALAIPLIDKAGFRGPVVHIAHDFETHVTRDIAESYSGNPVKKALLKLNAKRTAAAERLLAARCDLMVTLTEKDAVSFREINPRLDSLVIAPGYRGAVVESRTISDAVPKRVIAIGSYTWLAKRMNLLEFVQSADEFFFQNGIEFRVIGKIPEDFHEIRVRQWKATRLLGFVDDPTVEFDNARMGLVVDRTGGGFKLKMLDYIFQRVPVGGYTHALEGLPDKVAPHVVGHSETEPLLKAIVEAVNNPDRLQHMQVAAFQAAKGLFDWSSNGKRFIEKLNELGADLQSPESPRRAGRMQRGEPRSLQV